jgi:hypothetical protein
MKGERKDKTGGIACIKRGITGLRNAKTGK